jgi:hypothetical protein
LKIISIFCQLLEPVGGILLAARWSYLQLQNPVTTDHSISTTTFDSRNNALWMLTGVYEAQGELDKKMFIREIKHLKQVALLKWLLLGDFNLICQESDKNNSRINRSLMLQFRRALNHLEVREIQLVGRKYTWTNSQANLTMTRIDKAFCTTHWENLYANPVAQALSSAVSDHCPLLLVPVYFRRVKPKFKFECFWTEMDGFKECVQ